MKSEKPVLVDFWAEWCAPCRQVAPILEELSDEYGDAITIAKLDVDSSPVVSQALRIQSIPTMILFVNGRPVKSVQGALPKEALVEFIEAHVPALERRTIRVEELAQLLDRGAPIVPVDVRNPADFSRSHLRKARCIAVDDLPAELPKMDPNSLVVLICRTGEVSMEAAKSLAGSTPQVVALEKGLLEWEGSGHPTYSDKEEAKLDQAEA